VTADGLGAGRRLWRMVCPIFHRAAINSHAVPFQQTPDKLRTASFLKTLHYIKTYAPNLRPTRCAAALLPLNSRDRSTYDVAVGMLTAGDERFEVDDVENRANDERQDEILVNRDTTALQPPACAKQTHVSTCHRRTQVSNVKSQASL